VGANYGTVTLWWVYGEGRNGGGRHGDCEQRSPCTA